MRDGERRQRRSCQPIRQPQLLASLFLSSACHRNREPETRVKNASIPCHPVTRVVADSRRRRTVSQGVVRCCCCCPAGRPCDDNTLTHRPLCLCMCACVSGNCCCSSSRYHTMHVMPSGDEPAAAAAAATASTAAFRPSDSSLIFLFISLGHAFPLLHHMSICWQTWTNCPDFCVQSCSRGCYSFTHSLCTLRSVSAMFCRKKEIEKKEGKTCQCLYKGKNELNGRKGDIHAEFWWKSETRKCSMDQMRPIGWWVASCVVAPHSCGGRRRSARKKKQKDWSLSLRGYEET